MNQGDTKKNKVLILSPHPDDGLLGAGGTIAKFVEQKAEIKYVILSWAEQGFTKEEIKNALTFLGLKDEQIIIMNYQVRNFLFSSTQIREDLIKIREDFKPDLILCHSNYDFHQDHQIVHQESVRVFREKNMWGYLLPWNLREFKFNFFSVLKREHLNKKLKCMELLSSQESRFYYNTKKMEALAIASGLFRRKELCEVFEMISIFDE